MRPTTLVGLALMLLSPPASARNQLADASTFRRPKLAAGADSNSWLVYYNYGVSRLRKSPDDAEAAFVWASRIDPGRAEPLMGRWVTYWRRHRRSFEKYLKDTSSFIESPPIAAVESLRLHALQLNPFAPLTLSVALYERESGWEGSMDELTWGMRDYTAGHYRDAAFHFSGYVDQRPENYWARYYVALSFIASQEYDRAAQEITALLADKGGRTSAHLARLYQSQELLLYGLGVLHLMAGDTAAARASLGQALTENLAFYPAHALLADIALARGDTTQAVAEYVQAIELGPTDGVLHYRYARLLGDVGRLPDAESELRRAIELEPFFAPSYLGLALVLDTRGNRPEALEQYRRYLALTYRDDPRIGLAQQRIKALSQ